MSEFEEVTYRKCECGHPSCDQYTMNNQGSVGFSLKDARLFSAAPDMVDALEMMLKHEGGDAGLHNIAKQRAKSALAKARGETE